jgi:hemerythrin-like domain-containing protein
MKREKFLWALTGEHHEALMACRNIQIAAAAIRGDGMGNALDELSEKVGYFFKNRLEPHFRAEEKIMESLTRHRGNKDENIQRLFAEHKSLRALQKEGSLESLEVFAEELRNHIHFEENLLFPLIEKNLSEEEKKLTDSDLGKALAAETFVEWQKNTKGA